MADCVTQWLLYPLHKYLFSCLKKMSSIDATFDQDKGIQIILDKIANGKHEVYSLDLSAATDKLPLVLQVHILNALHPKLGDH